MSSGGGSGFDENAWRNRIESQLYELQKTQWNNVARITSLETSRDNDRTRHASTPAIVVGAISTFVAVAGFLFNMYLAGLKP